MRPFGPHDITARSADEIFEIFDVQESLGIPEKKQV
jgi:hypothetical protein